MERTCILIADRSRARLFDLEQANNPYHRYDLKEKVDLINVLPQVDPDARNHDGSRSDVVHRFSDRYYSGYDHRTPREEADERRFAKEIISELKEYVKANKPDHLIMVAPPQFLGALREYQSNLSNDVKDIQDIAKELSHLSATDIRDYLEKKVFH